jgi:hypothetical protein
LTNASLVAVTVGSGVFVGAISVTDAPNAVGVGEGTIAVEEGIPPGGVGVRYCPHRDASPTQDARRKETAINRAKIRFTIRPLRELYLC